MSVIRRLPYRTPKPERIIFGQWSMLIGDDVRPLPSYLKYWDPAVTIEAIIPIKIDCEGVAVDCGLGPDARLRIAALWASPGTVLCGRGDIIDLDVQYSEDQNLRVNVDGILASQMVNLTAQLLLLYPGRTAEPFAPTQIGSILISHTQTVRLEGEGSRFPVEIVDFNDTLYASESGWALYWNEDDLHQTFLGSVRLYINKRHEIIARAVSQHRPESIGVWETMRFDVARTLVYGALRNDEFVSMPDSFSHSSVGAAVRNLIKRCFPQMTMQQCRAYSRYRLLFETQLQAGLRVFREL